MTDFQNTHTVQRPRKSHRCAHCGSTIPAGVSHLVNSGIWEGQFYSDRLHHDCAALWTELFRTYGDWDDGMPMDLAEVIGQDETRDFVQQEMDAWRGQYPHVICRLELRWQRGDIKHRDRYLAKGLEPDPEDYPEVYG